MSEIAIGVAIVEYLPEEIVALEAAANLMGEVMSAIAARRAGQPPAAPTTESTGQAAWAAMQAMAVAHGQQRPVSGQLAVDDGP